ncbi:Homocysteine S-methyltransferase 2 [Nymphaea thermarum]|nr:Homocysteine S-methyltransferase 2 [Nymphaea thermarum]
MALSGDEFSLRIEDFLQQAGGCAVIDGGLATELERHGADLNDPLWSAKCLISSPHLIRQVHLDYLEAGADVLITASYQATIQGFESKGLSKVEAEALLEKSVQIACEARDEFMRRCISGVYEANGDQHTPKPHHILVAASVGSYGAYLADGSEYSGQYGDSITLEVLKDFHRRRVQVLANSGADLIAFETIPNKIEAQVLFTLTCWFFFLIASFDVEYVNRKQARVRILMLDVAFAFILILPEAYVELLEEGDVKIPAWLSFNSKDGVNVVSGDSLAECISIGDSCQKVVAVGINCTPPRFIHDLVISVEKVTKKPVLIYPNSGEMYDAEKKQWVESTGVSDDDFVPYVCNWREAGASLIGGCCRTTPNTIRAICRALNK